MNSKVTGSETMQKMAIALIVVLATITVIGLFSFGAAETVKTALSATASSVLPV